MVKIITGLIELIWNIIYFMCLILFALFWITWSIGIELLIKLRELWNKINWDIVFCFALLIYFETGLIYYAKAQLN